MHLLRLWAATAAALWVVLLSPVAAAATDLVAEGETMVGWRLERVERHPEYVRYFFTRAGDTTGLEVGASEAPTGPWTTGRHRLMPAPGQNPPAALLQALGDRLHHYDAAGGPPLAGRKRHAGGPGGTNPPDQEASWTIPGVPGQAPWPLWQPYPLPLWPVWCVLLGALWATRGRWKRLESALGRLTEHLKGHPWPWVAAIVVGMAALRLVHLDTPFSIDAMTQRVFFGSIDPSAILAHDYHDQRHPQLFYLILHGVQWLGHDEAIVRLPAVVFSLAAAVVLFRLAQRVLDPGPALVVTLLLGLNVAFLSHSREVGDLTLFTLLALLSTLLLVRALSRPKPWAIGAFALVEGAMFYAYYLAILVALAHGVALLIHGRSRRRRPVAWGLALALVVALPSLRRLYQLAFADRDMRGVAEAFPTHVWGERSSIELLAQLGGLIAPSMEALVVVVAVALVGAFRLADRPWRSVVGLVAGLTIVISTTVVGAAVVLVRLKPYYLLFILPWVLLFAVAGCAGRSQKDRAPNSGSIGMLRRDGLGVAVLAYLVGAYATDLSQRAGAIFEPSNRPRFDDLGEAIKRHGSPTVVIADPNYLHTIVLYYAFADPLALYRSCHIDDAGGGTQCHRSGDHLITLTLLPQMRDGWEQQSLTLLAAAQRGRPSWVVYTDRFENLPLLTRLQAGCELNGTFGDAGALRLFRCPASPSAQPEPQ
ncbi:MAG: hypothetical protein DRI90_03850 [Deltaproteobacteria bacterium]|nr:MAG: hypothetical protein DRI90_03850 [Deltaproteobacteria bacterium]